MEKSVPENDRRANESRMRIQRIEIATEVKTDLKTVLNSLNLKLFNKLNPPFPPVRVLRFDGTAKGGITHLSLNFLLFRQEWISENLVSENPSSDSFRFVDEGRKLPFFLKYWRHTHSFEEIRPSETTVTRITDSIEYSGRGLLGHFLQPILKLQFLYRKPVYRRIATGEFLKA